MASIDDLLAGLPAKKKGRSKIRKRHNLAITTATIRSDINVTPLVDVVLVLLIIFMVVTPMITRGMPVEMPQTAHHESKSDSGEQIVVSVTCNEPYLGPDRTKCKSHAVYVATERVDTEEQMKKKLEQEMRKGTGAREVHIKADKRLDYGPVRETMERIHAAGVSAVALGSDEIKEEKK